MMSIGLRSMERREIDKKTKGRGEVDIHVRKMVGEEWNKRTEETKQTKIG